MCATVCWCVLEVYQILCMREFLCVCIKKKPPQKLNTKNYIFLVRHVCVSVCVCVVVSPSVLSQGRPLEPWTHCNSYLFVFGYMCCMYACLLTHTDTLALQGLSKGYAAGEGQTDRATSHLSA